MAVNSGDVLDITFQGDFDLSEVINNNYQLIVETAGSHADADVLTDVEQWARDLFDIIKVFIAVLTVFRGLRVFNKTQGLLMDPIVFSPALPGTMAGEAYASGVCVLATFPTNVPRVVGRKYWGPVAEPAVGASGKISTAASVPAIAAVAFLTVPYVGATVSLSYGYDSPKALTFKRFFEGQVSPEPAYQRRRRRGTGV